MLRKIDFKAAVDLINSKNNFTRAYIEDNGSKPKVICFDIISEYNHDDPLEDCINWSERKGSITDRNKEMNLFDVFYNEAFQNDGSLSYVLPQCSIFELLQEEDYFNWTSENNVFYLTDGNMKEINELPEGCYIFIKT